MLKKFIFSCLFSYICLVFHVSLFNADTVIEKFVVDELKNHGYVTPPVDIEGWKTAFRSLAYEFSTLRLHHISVRSEYNHLYRDYSSVQKSLADVQKKLAAAVNDTIYWETNYHQAMAILTLRGNIELIEDIFHTEFTFPTRQTMMDTLRGKQNNQVKFPDVFSAVEAKILKDLKPETDLHTLKWIYYLSNCDTQYAINLRKFFKENNIPVLTFCQLVGSIYAKTCHSIHRVGDSKLTMDNIKEGLKLYGITNEAMLSCAKYIFLMQKISGALSEVTAA